jgi:hypothetical protein
VKQRRLINSKAVRLISAVLFACTLSTAALAVDEASVEQGKFHRFWPDNLYAVEFVSDKVGYVAGYSGSLFKTGDGGDTWSGIYMGSNELIRNMSFVDEQNGWAVGHRGSILHTFDAGLTWEVQHTDKGVYLRDISFADLNNGWAVGHDTHIWHTTDGGKTWQNQQLTGFEGRDLPRLHAVIAKDANTAILVGEFGVVAHTENAGGLWLVSYNADAGTLLSIAQQGDTAIAVGLDGGIFALTVATEDQRAEAVKVRAAKRAKLIARAMKKAKRRKKEYVPLEFEDIPETQMDFHVSKIDSGTTEHLYDVTEANGSVIAAGASSLLKISVKQRAPVVVSLVPAEGFPLPFVWMGGVSVTPSGDVWAAGIRGMIVKGSASDMTFGMKLNIAAPGAVKLVSNRWGEK